MLIIKDEVLEEIAAELRKAMEEQWTHNEGTYMNTYLIGRSEGIRYVYHMLKELQKKRRA